MTSLTVILLPLLGAVAATAATATTAPTAAEPAPPSATATTRTLDAITIEGVVDVPRVLFITSRENVRFDDGLGWTFVPTAAELMTAWDLPQPAGPLQVPASVSESNSEPESEPSPPAATAPASVTK